MPVEDFATAGLVGADLGRDAALPVRLLGLPAGFFATPEQIIFSPVPPSTSRFSKLQRSKR